MTKLLHFNVSWNLGTLRKHQGLTGMLKLVHCVLELWKQTMIWCTIESNLDKGVLINNST